MAIVMIGNKYSFVENPTPWSKINFSGRPSLNRIEFYDLLHNGRRRKRSFSYRLPTNSSVGSTNSISQSASLPACQPVRPVRVAQRATSPVFQHHFLPFDRNIFFFFVFEVQYLVFFLPLSYFHRHVTTLSFSRCGPIHPVIVMNA